MKSIKKTNIKINKNSIYIFNELYDNHNIRNRLFTINSFKEGTWFIDKNDQLQKIEYINIKLDDLPDTLYKITDNGNVNIKIKSTVVNVKDNTYKVITKYTIKNKNKLFNSIINKVVKIKNVLHITRINTDTSSIDIKLKIKSLLPFNTILDNYVANLCNYYIDQIIAYFSE
jgi:hypothetical protein